MLDKVMLAAAVLASGPAAAETWPSEAEWQPVLRDGAALTDPCGDASGSAEWDAVGDSGAPAVFWARQGDNVWFRLRLAGQPYRTGGADPVRWRNFGWGVMFEADGDLEPGSHELLLDIDADAELVVLAGNDAPTTPFALDPAETELGQWPAPLAESGAGDAGYAGWQAAGTDLCASGGGDYFVDWAVPWADLRAATGAADMGELALVFGTSSSGGRFNKDVVGCDDAPKDCDWADSLSDADLPAPDTGTPDTGTPDTGTPDTGTPDTGVPDTGMPDTGVPDTGVPDTGMPGTAPPVAGTGRLAGGCRGCSAGTTALAPLGLFMLTGLARRRRAASGPRG